MKAHLITRNLFPGLVLYIAVLLVLSYPADDANGVGLGYHVSGNVLYIDNVNVDNPVILDNDWWEESVGDEFAYAKCTLGQIDLRGLIATRDMWGYPSSFQYSLADCFNDLSRDVDRARQSGLSNIPDPTTGNEWPLYPPADYVIENTDYVSAISAGSNLIVQHASTASPTKPLIVIVGGAIDTVATAYMQDPSIADNMIVFDTGGSYNDKSAWPWQICMERTKFIYWEDSNAWANGCIGPKAWLYEFPDCPMTDYMEQRWPDNRNMHWADWFLLAYMYGKDHFNNAVRMELEPFDGYWHAHSTTSPDYDFIMIDDGMTNTSFEQTSAVDYYNTLMDPCVYGACLSAPDNVQASFVSFSQINITWNDTSSGDQQETGFIIERRPSGGIDTWTEVGSVDANITNYSDTTGTYGNVTYSYRVGAYR